MEPSAGIYARHSPYLDRYVQIGVVGMRLIAVSYPQDQPSDATSEHELLDRIDRYLDGLEETFEAVELVMTVDTDTRAVLDTVREIPYGTQRDIETIARMTPQIESDDLDTVTAALRENPVPPVIPGHRVEGGPFALPQTVHQRFRELERLD